MLTVLEPPKRAHHGPDRHTRASNDGPYISGGHTSSRGAKSGRGSKSVNQGGERRQYERRSGGLPDSQKKVDQGWGANEGEAELSGESLFSRNGVSLGWGNGKTRAIVPGCGGELASVDSAYLS